MTRETYEKAENRAEIRRLLSTGGALLLIGPLLAWLAAGGYLAVGTFLLLAELRATAQENP
jgi:hypothetical protein